MRRLLLPWKDEDQFSVETRDASPSNLLVKIQSFSSLSSNGIFKYESKEFEAGDYKWKMIIYPEEKESGKAGKHVGVYLSLQPQAETSSLPHNWEVNAIFTFFLYNHISHKYLCFQGKVRRFNAVSPKSGFSKMISKKSLKKGYLDEEGSCVFGAEVFVIKPQPSIIQSLCLQKATPPFKREWKVLDFSKLGNNIWLSEEFQVGYKKWKVRLYPKGNGRGEGRCISIFIECVDCKNIAPNHLTHKAEIRITIKNQLNNNIHRSWKMQVNEGWFTSSTRTWGYPEFMPIADMMDPTKGYLVKDCCFLQMEMSVPALLFDAPNPT